MNASYAALATRVAIVIAVAMVSTAAFYARGLEPGITFATNGIDLKIDSKGIYNGAVVPSATWGMKDLTPGVDKFFNFNDIKPGDTGCEVISMHVKKDDAWMCLDFKNLTEKENGVNEPESHEDLDGIGGGELADGTEFFGWMDDGDGKYEPPTEKALFGTSTQKASYVFASTTYAIADSRGGTSCKVESKRYVGMCWCAGNLTVASNGKMTCDANALGNTAQTDSFSVDIGIRAVPEKSDKKFKCGGYPPVTPPCTDCNNGPINININNNATVISNTTATSNTGGNTGGTNVTGNANSSASSTNILNRILLRIR